MATLRLGADLCTNAGRLYSLSDAVVAHFDPLRLKPVPMDGFARTELYRRLLAGAPDAAAVAFLTNQYVAAVVSLLKTLS